MTLTLILADERGMRRFASPLTVALFVAGAMAASAREPAPITYGRSRASAPPPALAPAPIERRKQLPPEPAPQSLQAAPAPDWAAGPGTPLSTWALQPEAAAPFDPAAMPRRHVVAAGETLYALSVRYQIPLRPLIEANRLDAPFALEVGQSLTLPPPRRHRVARGETLVSLARRFNIDARSLALLNRLEKPYAVRVGDTIVLPALARGEDATPEPAAPDPAPPPPAPASGPTRFAWPLVGRVLTRFGPQTGGRRSDGVDIAVANGGDVKAAADGRVIYAGNDLDGYGNLMLVQHAEGWITAYAHCSSFAVKEGDRVRQGQKVGRIDKGAAGDAKLHFQLRRGGTPIDPLASLPSL